MIVVLNHMQIKMHCDPFLSEFEQKVLIFNQNILWPIYLLSNVKQFP